MIIATKKWSVKTKHWDKREIRKNFSLERNNNYRNYWQHKGDTGWRFFYESWTEENKEIKKINAKLIQEITEVKLEI